jgi:chromate reductase
MSYHIVAINGSSRPDAHNARLLQAIARRYDSHTFDLYLDLSDLPLYLADQESVLINDRVIQLRDSIHKADAILISTPEYIHNIPAILKNALEWLTQSGEMNNKRTLPITYTPHEPRGKRALTSMEQSLIALNTQIISSLQLYQNELIIEEDLEMSGSFSVELLDAAMTTLIS